MRNILPNNRGVSTLIATIFVFILIIGIVAAQLVSLQRYNDLQQSRLSIEENKANEKLHLIHLTNQTVDGFNKINDITVKNSGSVTVELGAVYIDQVFLFDPSNGTINPNGNKLNPNSTLSISLQGLDQPQAYNGDSLISMSTNRGTLTTAYESALIGSTTIFEAVETSFGPLMLNYTEFYHAAFINSNTIGPWKLGWTVSTSEGQIVWKVNATNVDSRDVQLDRNSSLTLMAIASPSDCLPWYLNITSPLLVKSNQTVTLVFVWSTPDGGAPKQAFSTACESKVFLVCFGTFKPSNVPYAQTIPFQSVEVYGK